MLKNHLFDYGADDDGEMVGGRACAVFVEHKLFGRVAARECRVGALVAAIGVGQDAVFLDFDAGSDEDVVETAVRVVFGREVVECAVEGVCEVADDIRVAECAVVGDCLVALLVLVEVEVAGEEDGECAVDFLHLLADELGALETCLDADVVHVEVEEEKFAARIFVAEFTPCADAGAGCVPAFFAGDVGCLAEPEVAVIDEAELVGIVEDGRVLAAFFAVFAAYADVFEAGEGVLEVIKLVAVAFLGAEDVELMVSDERREGGETSFPSVADHRVAAVVEAQVIGGEVETRGRLLFFLIAAGHQGDGHEHKGKNVLGFHEDVVLKCFGFRYML